MAVRGGAANNAGGKPRNGRNYMSNSKLTRRGLLKSGAVAGAGLAMPTLFTSNVWAGSHGGYTNAPSGSVVTLGFNEIGRAHV